MADAQKTIDLIFNGVDRTGAATMSALNNAQKFTSSLQNVTQPIADFTMGAVKLEAGLLAAGLAMTVFATKTAGDFSQAFAQINTLFDASAEDTAKFKNDIQEYAATSGKSFEDVMGAINAAIGQGVKWSESLDLISTAEKLAIATKSDLTSTTTTLVGTMRAYGMDTSEAGKVADLFFQTIKDGKIEMGDLAKSFAMITPLASTAGVSLEEVFSAIAVMTSTGMAPSQSIEYLRSALTNIIKPSEQAKDLAAQLGIQFDANALKSKGLAGVLDDVSRATAGSAGQMNILIGDAGGMVAAALLAKNGAKELKDEMILMGNATGSVDVAFKKMAGEIDVVAQKVGNAFKNLMITIGTPMLEEFGGIADAIAQIFLILGKSVKEGALKDLAAYIESVFKDVQKSLETVSKNLPAALATADFSGFKNGIDSVLKAMKAMFSSFDITSVQGLKDIIELVGLAFFGLSKYVSGVIESFKPLFNTLIEVGKGAKAVDLTFLQIGGNLGGLASQLNLVLPLFNGLLAILTVKQGLNLVTDLKSLPGVLSGASAAAGAAGLAGALMGPVGLTAAAGAAGYAVGTLANNGISSLLSKLTGSETTLGGFIYDLVNSGKAAGDMGTKTGAAAEGVNKLSTAAKDSKNPFEEANNALLKSGGLAKTAGDEWGKSAKFLELTAAAAKNAADKNKALSDSADVLKAKASGISPIFDALTGKIIGYEQTATKSGIASYALATGADKAGASLKNVGTETDKAKEATKKWNEEVAKMAFEEKIKLIDSQTKIATASIESYTKIMVSAFDSVSNTITSTGDVLKGLQGQMSGFDNMSFSTQFKIEDQINKENKRRDDALKLQTELTRAQIDQMKAQTKALESGEGMIKIDGAGLQPHLEGFMWEILRTIQVRVNKDGLKMLLGA